MQDWSIVEFLEARDGDLSVVFLKSGQTLRVFNIAAGIDIGDQFPHITSNISPDVGGESVDFFSSGDVSHIEDGQGKLLLRR